ncbi:MAG: hypothetical protein RL594_471 [Bacteroidota bacterium]|jgi:hypothetical protein
MGFQDRIQPRTQAASSEEIDLLHAARVTSDQVGAIATWLDYNKVLAETREFVGRMSKPKKLSPEELKQVRLWLTNAWSTEYLLSNIAKDLGADAVAFSVHWAFPQTYYAVFALRMAWSTAAGHYDRAHPTVIRRFGLDSIEGRLPESLAPCLTGIDADYHYHYINNVEFTTDRRLNRSDVDSVKGYISSALRTTRSGSFEKWKADNISRFMTKKGAKRKSLSREQKLEGDSKIGPTSVISYLYRKRIKANYDDVDVFHNDMINAPLLNHDLQMIVRSFSVVHEAMIARKVGKIAFSELVNQAPPVLREFKNRQLTDLKLILDV